MEGNETTHIPDQELRFQDSKTRSFCYFIWLNHQEKFPASISKVGYYILKIYIFQCDI